MIRSFLLILLFCHIVGAACAQSCDLVFNDVLIEKKGLDLDALKESRKAFLGKSYGELRLLRPTGTSIEADLVYIEALSRSLMGSGGVRAGVFKRMKDASFYHLLSEMRGDQKIKTERLEEMLSSYIEVKQAGGPWLNIRNRIFTLESRDSFDNKEFLTKLWLEPISKMFEERSFKSPTNQMRRDKIAKFLRAIQSLFINAFSLTSSGYFLDAYYSKSMKTTDLVKENEYFSISLKELYIRYQQQYHRVSNKDHFAKILTKLTRIVGVTMLSVQLGIAHFPVELLYMSESQLKTEIAEVMLKKLGPDPSRSQVEDIELYLLNKTPAELVKIHRTQPPKN